MTAGPIPADAYLMIIGAMKCGTSSLYSYLAQHPAICGAKTKEPEYFSQYQGHRAAVARYQDLWDFDAARHRYALEASTGYTKFPQEAGVAERIRDAGLQPRFIYLVRNPIERIESHMRHIVDHGDLAKSPWPLLSEYLVYLSSYHLQLSRFLRVFPRERFLVLDVADLDRDPAALVARIFDWLNLPRVEGLDYGRQHVSAAGRTGWRRLLGGRRHAESKVRLPEWDRQFVFNALGEDMQRFAAEFGFDVTAWGFQSSGS